MSDMRFVVHCAMLLLAFVGLATIVDHCTTPTADDDSYRSTRRPARRFFGNAAARRERQEFAVVPSVGYFCAWISCFFGLPFEAVYPLAQGRDRKTLLGKVRSQAIPRAISFWISRKSSMPTESRIMASLIP